MGRSLTEWHVKVRALVRVASRRAVATDRIETVGLRPAFTRYSGDRPRELVVEVAGTGSPYLTLPVGWVPGASHLDRVECPARQIPPNYLDDKAWLIVPSIADVTVENVLLAITPAASSFVRLFFTAPWPFPTNDPSVDQANDLAFEAVSSLAASYVITNLALDAARRRAEQAAAPDAKPAGIPDQSLLALAKAYEATYLRFIGVDPETPGTTTVAPFSMTMDYDPQADSIFHGGPR